MATLFASRHLTSSLCQASKINLACSLLHQRYIPASSQLPSKATTTRPLSSSSDDRTYTLLYYRSPKRQKYPRATLAFSSFNLTYWLWYTFDFTPSVNASAHEKAAIGQIDAETLQLLLVDDFMGYVGLGVALVIWGGSIWYPRNLVSAIWISEGSGDEKCVALSTLKLPLVTQPSILDRMKFIPLDNTIGNKSLFTEAELKTDSSIQFFHGDELALVGEREKNDILIKLDGELSKKQGHLALQVNNDETADATGPLAVLSKKNYLLDIDEGEVMPGADIELLRAFLTKEDWEIGAGGSRKVKEKKQRDTRDQVQDHDASETIIRPKRYGKKKR
jgi:hypothetical protein